MSVKYEFRHERCCAVMGGPGQRYCSNRARSVDANGRPICGVHRSGQVDIEWFGDWASFPHGTGGTWWFARGEYR